MELLGIEFNPNNFFVISQKIEQIVKIMDVASSNRDGTIWR